MEGNVATSGRGENNKEEEEEWDFEVSFASKVYEESRKDKKRNELASGCIIEPEEEIAFASLIGLDSYNYDSEVDSVLPDSEMFEEKLQERMELQVKTPPRQGEIEENLVTELESQEPMMYEEASDKPEWRKAMEEELEEKLGGEKKEDVKYEVDTSLPVEEVDELVQSKKKEKEGLKEEIEEMIVDKFLVIKEQVQEVKHEEGRPLQAQEERIEGQRQIQEKEREGKSHHQVPRRSSRQWKSNPRYVDVALIMELKLLEPTTYKKASKKFKRGKIRGEVQRRHGMLKIPVDGESSR